MLIEHNGYTATLDWREGNSRPAWWLRLGAEEFPVSADQDGERVAAMVRERFIGSPPPTDHATIWGGYACGSCRSSGIRLWRDYQTFLDVQTLRCRSCAEAHAGKPKRANSDQIGGLVPAVPTADGSTFWGYTSVPLAGVDWWLALPDVNPAATAATPE